MGLRREPVDRHGLIERRVAQILRPGGVGTPHRLDDEMRRRRRPGPGGGQVVALQDVEHLDEGRAPGANRRHRDDGVAAIGAGNRRPAHGAVGGKILTRDQTAVRRHLPLDELGGLALVEPGRALLGDAHQRSREVRLAERLPRLIRLAVPRELRDRRRVVRHPRQHAGEGPGQGIRQGEPFARQRDRRLDQPLPAQRPVLGPGQV